MTYDIKLLEADIRDPMDGTMTLGIARGGHIHAKLAYTWDDKKFAAVFHGHAPSLPEPAHPTVLLRGAVAAIQALRTDAHSILTDVFRDHSVVLTVEAPKG